MESEKTFTTSFHNAIVSATPLKQRDYEHKRIRVITVIFSLVSHAITHLCPPLPQYLFELLAKVSNI